MGSTQLDGGNISKVVKITSTGSTSNNVNVTCISGNCTSIINNFTNDIDILVSENRYINFTCSDEKSDYLSATYRVNSSEDPTGDDLIVNCTITSDTCTPPGHPNVNANWNVDLKDNCTITKANFPVGINMRQRNVNITNITKDGYFVTYVNITNISSRVYMDAKTQGFVRCIGGCFSN